MIPRTWRKDVAQDAGSVEAPAAPNWAFTQGGYVPFCQESCPHHDGKRCRVMGLRAPNICEPVVVQMSRLLSAEAR